MSDCDYVYLKGKRIARRFVVLRDATPEELTIIVNEAETAEALRRVLANPNATAKVRQEAQARLDDWERIA